MSLEAAVKRRDIEGCTPLRVESEIEHLEEILENEGSE